MTGHPLIAAMRAGRPVSADTQTSAGSVSVDTQTELPTQGPVLKITRHEVPLGC